MTAQHTRAAPRPLETAFPVSVTIDDPPQVGTGHSAVDSPFTVILYARDTTTAASILADLSWSAGKQSLLREAVAGMGFDLDVLRQDMGMLEALFDVRIDEQLTVGFGPRGRGAAQGLGAATAPIVGLIRVDFIGRTISQLREHIEAVLTPAWTARAIDTLNDTTK